MGRFDGILLCADIDGTLTFPFKGTDGSLNDNGPTPETCDRIRWFQENGGWFTVASGRKPSHLEHYTDKFRANAPLVCCGGGLVYDTAADHVLRFEPMRFDLPALLRAVGDLFPFILDMQLHGLSQSLTTRPERFCNPECNEWQTGVYLKLVMRLDTAAHAVEACRRMAQTPVGKGLCICRSWPEGVEIMERTADKGAAVLFLKKYLGARQLICVGDFENDLPMLRVADRAVAVENALPEVKAAAHETTVSVFDGAVGRVIDTICSEDL